jgi:hypothetical protein
MGISGGKGSSSGNQQAVLTPEQREALQAQTNFLTGTAFPAYQKTLAQANDVYGNVSSATKNAANQATNVAQQTGGLQQATGSAGLLGGMAGLASLFGPQYKEQQVQGALQAGREATREQLGQQNAMYGGAGGLGSSRQALADTNLRQLGEQRQATAAATASAGVEANRAAAANQLATIGGQNLGAANQAAAAQIGYAGAPQDALSKYASVIFGTPQASTTPNFAGTQGSTGSSSSKGGGIGINLSDITTKQNIQKIGVLDNGINLYKYEYKPEFQEEWGYGTQIGVMAQEVEQVRPEAVMQLANGFKAVNYSMVYN